MNYDGEQMSYGTHTVTHTHGTNGTNGTNKVKMLTNKVEKTTSNRGGKYNTTQMTTTLNKIEKRVLMLELST